jgi:predicted HNH restriction endonuclease
LCELFKINRKTFRETQILIQDRLEAGEFYAYSEQSAASVYQTISPRDLEKDVALERIVEESRKGISEGVVNLAVNRERNINLINLMRSFYVTNFRNGENGLIKCDACGEVTFLTYNEIPYLEFHHLIPFSTDFGPDHYLNLLGICPSCHKKFHFAKPVEKEDLYRRASANNNIKISLRRRVNSLFEEKAIEPIHLDFLLKEKIITSEEHGLLMSNQLLNLNE